MPGWIYMAATDWTNRYATTAERLFLGFTMMLVGLVIVFVMLLVISWAIRVMPLFMKKKRHTKAEDKSPVNVPAVRPAAAPVAAAEDGQLVAVISAALTASLSESSVGAAPGFPGAGFRVRRIRRLG